MKTNTKYLHIQIKNSQIQVSGDRNAFFGYAFDAQPKAGGVWAKWEYHERRVAVENDYSGHYTLFYYTDKHNFIISDSILKVAQLSKNDCLDQDALAVFCRCGFFLANDTAFKDIKTIPPDCKLTWEEGKLNIQSNLRITPPEKLTVNQMVDGYIDKFRTAIQYVAPQNEDFILPLSGGKDSRLILFELLRLKSKPRECVTCGESRDTKASSILTEQLGLNQKFIKSNPKWVKDETEKNTLTQFNALEHGWLMELGRYLNANTNTSYEGTGIGIFTRSELLIPELFELLENEKYEDIATWLFNKIGPGENFLKLLKGKFRFIGKKYDIAVSMVANEIKKHRSAANPLSSFNFWNWNRRAIAMNPYGIQSGVKNNYAPYLDIDLYDFVSSFDPEITSQSEPQKIAIKKAYPQYSNIPFYDELKKAEKPRRSLLSRLSSFGSAFGKTTKNDLSLIPPMLKAKLLPHNRGLKKDMNKFIIVAIYLGQLRNFRKGLN